MVNLQKITEKNWLSIIALAVYPFQEKFVSSTAWSLAEAYIKPGAPKRRYLPLAVYDENQLVGFLSICYDPDSTDCYWINDVLIDKAWQGRGYGRAAMQATIARIQADFPRCTEIGLTVVPGNARAEKLYGELGFVNTGVVFEGEIEWKLPLRR